MRQPIRSFDRIVIPTPCNTEWDAMIGNDQVRFCKHCCLHVTNLSRLTRREAIRLVARSEGRLCVRLVQKRDGSPFTKQLPQGLHQIGRRVSRLAAGAFTATLSLSSGAAAQTESKPLTPVARVTQNLPPQKMDQAAGSSSLSGTIIDPNGAVVPHAAVVLKNEETSTENATTSSDEGEYTFQNISTGTYKLRITSPGFKAFEINSISLSANANERFDASLEVSGIVTMGAVAFVEPEEPLVKAAFKDDLEGIKQLMFSSLDLNVRDKNTNMTALEQAVENGNLEIVQTLLLAGAKANAESESGGTVLMYLRDSATAELVRELISAGARVNARDGSGGTALMNAASASKYDVVRELIDAGAKVDLKDANGYTALLFAATNSDPRITKLLIDAGSDIDAKDNTGKTALMMAAEEGDPETVKVLISFNAEINAVDNDGCTALMHVAGTSDLESAQALLNAGADLNLRDKDGRTALALARAADQEKMAKLLESRGAPE